MHGVGFEPTRLSPHDLKSCPLDHSGIHAYKNAINRKYIKWTTKIKYLLYVDII